MGVAVKRVDGLVVCQAHPAEEYPDRLVGLTWCGLLALTPAEDPMLDWLGVVAGLGDDNYRLCQMVYLPSFRQESAVYIVDENGKAFVVVSRTMKKELWTQMLGQMEKASPTKNSISLDSIYQSAALRKIRAAVDTRTASLDAEVATIVTEACRSVLLRVSYPKESTAGLDGTTYHAGHWIPGAFLSGKTWSPKKGTVAAGFVAMEMALQAYADSATERRAALRLDLLEKAKRLKARVNAGAEDPSAPANPALQTDRASPGR